MCSELHNHNMHLCYCLCFWFHFSMAPNVHRSTKITWYGTSTCGSPLQHNTLSTDYLQLCSESARTAESIIIHPLKDTYRDVAPSLLLGDWTWFLWEPECTANKKKKKVVIAAVAHISCSEEPWVRSLKEKEETLCLKDNYYSSKKPTCFSTWYRGVLEK